MKHHMSGILRVLIYIEENLDGSLELEKLAKIARISPFYFHRLFRIYVNETVADYVKRLRLQRAAQHLQYSSTPITNIALDIGYETPSAFTKVFNQMMGQSPRAYRKKMTKITQEEKMLKPTYVTRKDEEILFCREVGDYNVTPDRAFATLKKFLEEKGVQLSDIRAFYGMALDDQHIVQRSLCRFDACVAIKRQIKEEGEIGKKVLKGGKFAVFTHYGKGTPDELENTLDNILRIWYPSMQENETMPFFEFVHCLDMSTPIEIRQTNIYIPVKK